MRRNRRAVIFDMDGVMVQTAPQHFAAWKRALATVGYELTEDEFRATFGMRNQEIIRHLLGEDVGETQVAELARLKEEHYRALVGEGIEPAPGLLPLLRQLKERGFRLAVGTSAPRENVELILDALGIGGHFDAVVAEEDVERGKPYPDAFLLAAERCGVDPERCVVIEDAPSGLAAARAAGMKCIGIAGTRKREELHRADLVVDSLMELDVTTIERLLEGGSDHR